MKKKILLFFTIVILTFFSMIISTQVVQALPPFNQGSQYCKGAYDLNAAQPTAYDWTRQSRFKGPSTSQLFWSFSAGDVINCSPAIGADGTIYFGTSGTILDGTGDNNLYAVKPDGTIKWVYPIQKAYITSSPAIGADGTIYFGASNRNLYALYPDGTLRWAFDTKSQAGYCCMTSPAIGADGTIYVVTADSILCAITPSGNEKWSYKFNGTLSDASPIIGADGTIYVGALDNNLYAFRDDVTKGTLKWQCYTGGMIGDSPAIGSDGTIYVGAYNKNVAKLCAINPSGTENWELAIPDCNEIGTGLAIGTDGTIYVGSNGKNGGCLCAINPTSKTLKWTFGMLSSTLMGSTPIIGADGTIYVGSNIPTEIGNKLYAINPDGSTKWNMNIGDVFPSPAIGKDGTLYVASYTLLSVRPITKESKLLAINDTIYTISFDSNGGSPVSSIKATPGINITPPMNPVLAGCIFKGWYKDPQLTTPWNFNTDTVAGNTNLYAKWVPDTPPSLNLVGTVHGKEGDPISITLAGSDLDGDQLTYSASALPQGASFDPTTKTFTWTPGFTQAGTYNVNFTVSDGILSSGVTATIVVENVNRSPVLNPIATVYGKEGSPISFPLIASDPDGDSLTYAITNCPFDLSYDSLTKLVTFTPGFTDSGTYTFYITVSDDSLSDTKAVTIVIENVNRCPALNSIDTVKGKEGNPISITLTGSDPDGDALTYSANNLPKGASFNPATKTFTWTPDFTQAGTYNVNFTVSDGSLSDTKAATVVVENVNCSPVLNSIDTVNGKEGSPISITLTGSDPDDDTLTYSASDLPKGASFDPATKTFTWTPDFTQSGTYTVNFTVSDGSLSDSKAATIVVGNVNRSPVLNSIDTVNGKEGNPISITLAGSDPDGDILTYSASDLPTGASFDPTSRTFTWTPDFTQAGTYTVNFAVSDGSLSDSKAATIVVENVNRSPVLNPIDTVKGKEGSPISITLTGSDPDGDSLTYSASDLPQGASFDSLTKTFTWTPDFTQAGTYTVNFAVSDGSLSDSKAAAITVENVNRSPVLNPVGTVKGKEGSPISITLTGSDPDGDALTYSASDLPKGASFDPVARTFTWTPDFTQAGTYTVNFAVSDGSLSDSKAAAITVENVNRSPVLNPIGTVKGKEGSSIIFTLTGSDPDGDALTYSASSLPHGASFNPITRTFTWTPSFTQEGTYTINFTVSDGNLSDTKAATVIVADVNQSPILDSIGTLNGKEGIPITITLTASDYDGDQLRYSVSSLPQGASFDPSTRTFKWTPGFTQAGTYTVNFTVSDGSLSNTKAATIVVENVNRSPVLNPVGTVNAKEGCPIRITLTSSDPDSDALTYSVSGLPQGASFDPIARTLTWTPGYAQAGKYTINFAVNDGSLSDAKAAVITVENVNRTPVLNSVGTVNVKEGSPITITLTASDPDNDALTYSASGLPQGASFDPAAKTFKWTPELADTYTINFKVSDGNLSDTQNLTIKVTAVISLESISFDPSTLSLINGNTYQVKVVGTFTDNSIKDLTSSVTYSSSNKKVASVDRFGLVTANGIGKAIIRTALKDGTKSAAFKLTVTPKLKYLTIASKTITIEMGKKSNIKVTAFYENGKKYDITKFISEKEWTENSNDVISVSKGIITAKRIGSTKINVSYQGKPVQVNITVIKQLKKLSTNTTSAKLSLGSTAKVTITAMFNISENEIVTDKCIWKSSKKSVAYIKDGVIHAVSKGTAKLTATWKGKSISITVTVK